MGEKEKKTDLRILKTQKALCESFIKICSEKDFEAISVQELCDTAMVRRATFYRHFTDKYDFFSFFIRYLQKEMMEGYYKKRGNTEHEDSMEDYIAYLFLCLAQFLTERKSMLDHLLNSNAAASLTEMLVRSTEKDIYEFLEKKKEEGWKPFIDNHVFAAFLAGGTIQMIWNWYKQESNFSSKVMYQEAQKLIGILEWQG